jgi:hypothetical protein
LTRAFLRLKEDEYRAAREEVERLRKELDGSARVDEAVAAEPDVAVRKAG